MARTATHKDHHAKPRRRRSTSWLTGSSGEAFSVKLSPRTGVIVDPKKKLTAGCYVLVMSPSKVWKLGRYWPGSPAKFAQDVRPIDDLHWTHEGEEILKPRRPVPKSAAVYRVIGTQRFNPVAPTQH